MKSPLIYYGCILCLVGACATNKTNLDYDTSANFASFKTYAWSDLTDEKTGKSRVDTPLVHQRVRESIEQELNTKGLQKVEPAQADLLVTYHLSVVPVGHSSGSVSLGLGRYSGRSSVGVSVGVPIGTRVVEEGTLAIDLINTKTNSIVWRGIASRKLSNTQLSPEQTTTKIHEVVAEILAKYPPGR